MLSKLISGIVTGFLLLLAGNARAQKVTSVGAICITVKELAPSLKFYTDVLQFKLIATEHFYGENHEQLFGKFGIHYKIAHLQLGDEYVDLIDYLTSGGRSIPETQQSNDLAFQHIAIVVRDMDAAFKTLQKHNVEFVSTVPQTIPLTNNAAAGIKAFYFHDNDNHNLELIYFPKGKGKTKWQTPTKSIFLGIDHTAIGVSNTNNSLQYWVNNLSLEKKGESHNTGTEQAHLNFIKNAELQITGLAATAGPGVEFLQYLKPGAGKSYPADTQCDDLWNWLTKVNCTGIDALFSQLKAARVQIVSEAVVVINGKKNFIARDPDGHAVWFIEN
jgi:catechol 2,3-dioxygenase-like lactoylglutathione lyase family enzyme